MNQQNHPGKTFLLGNIKHIKNACSSIPHSSDNCIILCFTDINGNLETDLAKKLSKRWKKFSEQFRGWYRNQIDFKLGKILKIAVQSDTEIVAMLVLNEGILDLEALKDAMILTGRYAVADKKNIHINKNEEHWDKIEKMLNEYFIKSGINVSVYE